MSEIKKSIKKHFSAWGTIQTKMDLETLETMQECILNRREKVYDYQTGELCSNE